MKEKVGQLGVDEQGHCGGDALLSQLPKKSPIILLKSAAFR